MAHNYFSCYDGDVYWYSGCNIQEEKKEECGTQTCENQACKWAFIPGLNSGSWLIRPRTGLRVYKILNNKLLWIPTAEAFNKAGYVWTNVQEKSETETNVYSRLKLATTKGDSKVYYLTESGLKRWIPTLEIFNSYDDNWQDVVELSATDLEMYEDNVLIKLESGINIYKLENGKKRWIQTQETFNRLKYDWNKIAPVNQVEFDYYPEGAIIE